MLNESQQEAVERFIQSRKGFVGIYSTADTEHKWPWYKKLVGRSFITHPKIQTARLNVAPKGRQLPGLSRMPDKFLWTDEWYQFSDAHVEELNYLLSVDESSYNPSVKHKTTLFNGIGKFHTYC
ncbi:ThuA domain-containing protein [Shewanella sp. 10N.7]|uniref:ThuA domain-containing protein n=1 Tax=Shewanella sp. 10N.7 TaxID=2885093 RepID=UPI001E28C3A8